MSGVSRSVIIKAPMERVYDVITDFESYDEFLPEITQATMLSKGDGECEVEFHANIVTDIRYTLHFILEPPQRIVWSLLHGQMMSSNDGSWELTKQGQGTEATYSIDVGFGPLVPKAITRALVDSNLPDLLQRVKARAEEVSS